MLLNQKRAVWLGLSIILLYAARNSAFAVETSPSNTAHRIQTIDFYGLHKVTEQQVRAKLRFKEGSATKIDKGAVLRELLRIPGVKAADITTVINAGNKLAVFVGIEEDHTRGYSYRPAPRGSARLPAQALELYDRHAEALVSALAKADPQFDEDDSQGHALFTDPALRALEDKMIRFAASNLQTLRTVLKDSADGHQRAAAAWIIGYAPDKRLILGDLIDASADPDEGVRNNATRAIGAIAEFANKKPQLGIYIDPSRFVDMLSSITWTDRNKATSVLFGLTESRPAKTLRQLKDHALPQLAEMARWKDSHSEDALRLLGRVAGWKDQEIETALNRRDRERIITAALSSKWMPRPEHAKKQR